jgi:hypothetical protein
LHVASPPDTVDIEQVRTRIDDIVSSNQPVSPLPSLPVQLEPGPTEELSSVGDPKELVEVFHRESGTGYDRRSWRTECGWRTERGTLLF